MEPPHPENNDEPSVDMSISSTLQKEVPSDVPREKIESAVVRFAGDSGDGMQLTGGQFTLATALAGNDLATFPDFPAEIRAPAGTTFGVSFPNQFWLPRHQNFWR